MGVSKCVYIYIYVFLVCAIVLMCVYPLLGVMIDWVPPIVAFRSFSVYKTNFLRLMCVKNFQAKCVCVCIALMMTWSTPDLDLFRSDLDCSCVDF